MKCCGANNSPISGNTLVCGVIGDPIEHTLSPVLQNAAFQHLGLDYVYLPFKVKANSLGQAVRGMRGLNIRGLNVTIPHKQAILSILDDIDPLAEVIGAVNTVVNTRGVLKGYNTDATGFSKVLTTKKVAIENKNTTVLGAGGASRAIIFVLADKGANITILNRHVEAAQKMADWILKIFRKEVKVMELNQANLETALPETEVLVNTTSVGMVPDIDQTLVPGSLLRPELTVVDIIYNPFQTRLLAEAANRGAKVVNGLEMLVQQGAASFELWTGRKAPLAVMREAVWPKLQDRS